MNFEIRIFANPAGFKELCLSQPQKYSLFSDEVVAKRNFDGERGRLPNGTFSVYFTPDAYIIAYHFLLSSETQFRDGEAHIAVAIRRGFKMIEPTATFQELANVFARIAIEYKQSAANQIYHNSGKFYDIVSSKIVDDQLQFKYNTTYSVSKRAIIAPSSQQDRDIVLSDPFRPEFKNVDILFVIKYEDGPEVAHLTSKGYKPIANIELHNPRTFTLVYPDGNRVAFTDFNQELPEYTIHRKHEKPLTYSGSVGANMDKWKITVSEDKSEYIIGLQPEKDTKEFKIMAYDNKTIIAPSQISVTIGQFSKGIWILEGEDIEKINKSIKDFVSIKGYQINSTTRIDDSTITINASQLYHYDLSEIFNFLKDAIGQNAKVTIHSKTSQLGYQVDYKCRKCDLPIPYSEASIIVPETLTTEETTFDENFSGMVSLRSVKKKKTGEITISFAPDCPKELIKKLNNGETVGKVTYRYRYELPDRKKSIQKDEPIYSYPVEIKNLPLLKVQIEVEVKGYHVFQEEVNLKKISNQEVVCRLKPTISRRVKQFSKKYLPTFVVGIILGAFIGLCVANTWGGFLPSYKAMSDEIAALSADTLSLRQENSKLMSQIDYLKDSKLTGNEDSVLISQEEEPYGLSDEQKKLISKLKGETFTKADVIKAKNLLEGMGQDDLIKDAEACLIILNLNKKEKQKVKEPGSETYNLTVKKLGVHKDTMLEIINNKNYVFTGQNFKSIKELKNKLNEY